MRRAQLIYLGDCLMQTPPGRFVLGKWFAGATAGWTAITAGDFNGDAASDVLLQDNASGNAQILFLNVNTGEPIGQVRQGFCDDRR